MMRGMMFRRLEGEEACHGAWNGRGTPHWYALGTHAVPDDNIDKVLTMQAFHGDSTQESFPMIILSWNTMETSEGRRSILVVG